MRHVRLRLALALALASRARAAPAPELMKVALAGSGHLQAYGVPYSDNHAHTLAGPTPLHFRPPQNLDLPIPSSSSAAGALRAAARAGVLLPAPGACNDYPVPFASCNFTCSVCQADPGGVTKVTCVDPGSGKVGLGENAVAATAIREAVSAVTLLLDVGPGHRDCACIQPVARVESANCTLLGSYCLYFPSASASASGFTPLLRAKVWDAASPKYIGASKGWGEPADGYNATIPSAPYDSTLAAARAMRAANPARKCNPGKVPPNPPTCSPAGRCTHSRFSRGGRAPVCARTAAARVDGWHCRAAAAVGASVKVQCAETAPRRRGCRSRFHARLAVRIAADACCPCKGDPARPHPGPHLVRHQLQADVVHPSGLGLLVRADDRRLGSALAPRHRHRQ